MPPAAPVGCSLALAGKADANCTCWSVTTPIRDTPCFSFQVPRRWRTKAQVSDGHENISFVIHHTPRGAARLQANASSQPIRSRWAVCPRGDDPKGGLQSGPEPWGFISFSEQIDEEEDA